MKRFVFGFFQNDKLCGYFYTEKIMTATLAPIGMTSFLVAGGVKRNL
ncbi:hypothetical protein [Chryseobacterium sp. 8AT]|nr:hypothetical protein [Chryseobacterium sp. 8AT]VXB07518.1 hypothetical protein CHRYSEO8AT_100033 [Chryseobacterium sp. 8AT]